jgi:RNA polymerase sigma-70 factor (ECF subfamily)
MIAAEAHGATDTDEQLMGRVADGDLRAFETIYDRYHLQAYWLARRITGAAGAAEEATQDAFISLWRRAASFDAERASLRTWLYALVRNRSIDTLRRGARQALHQELTPDAVNNIEAPERTEEQVLVIDDYDRALRLLAELPREQREVIDLAYLAGYSQNEIAAKVGIPLGTVKGRVRLGLRKLRHAAQCESVPMPTA